ncbi:hypothetical protein E2C01_002611 [Portunus trituberculatus]|uniref:Uncharacterized protein n=1 Tax=Portunus trituberculatus TaxID=210409 RepID=A0A5B7CNQ2_PORTR|nr:hypothetical protein [Portunus trituberculatus]
MPPESLPATTLPSPAAAPALLPPRLGTWHVLLVRLAMCSCCGTMTDKPLGCTCSTIATTETQPWCNLQLSVTGSRRVSRDRVAKETSVQVSIWMMRCSDPLRILFGQQVLQHAL